MDDDARRRHRAGLAGGAWVAVLALGVLLAAPAGGPAQTTPASVEPASDEPPAFKPRLVLLPFVYYTPETRLAFGVGGVLTFKAGAEQARTRTSTVWAFGTYSLARQIQVSINPTVYFERNDISVSANLRYERTPLKFYGVGNDTPSSLMEPYTPRIALVQAGLKKRLLGGLFAGLLFDLERTTMEKIEAEGLLDTAGLPGSRGGLVSGLVLSLDWDTRDGAQFPRSGTFLQLTAGSYSPALGSDFRFSSLKLDLRQYLSPSSGHVLAMQAVLRLTSGDTPFYRLSMLGGDSLLRGYYKGRFRDKDMIVVQAEYRVALGEKFGLAGFAGLGHVIPRFGDLGLKSLKYSLGTGLRYSLDARAGSNIRMDMAWGVRSFGLYFTAQESF